MRARSQQVGLKYRRPAMLCVSPLRQPRHVGTETSEHELHNEQRSRDDLCKSTAQVTLQQLDSWNPILDDDTQDEV